MNPALGRSVASQPHRPDSRHLIIAMGDAMAHIQASTETYALLLQAKDFLVEARRLKPGPARNELREVAKVLREIAKVDAQAQSVSDPDRAGRA